MRTFSMWRNEYLKVYTVALLYFFTHLTESIAYNNPTNLEPEINTFEGDELELRCDMRNFNESSEAVAWSFDNVVQFLGSKVLYSGSRIFVYDMNNQYNLRITNATLMDTKMYMCERMNKSFLHSRRSFYRVKVIARPETTASVFPPTVVTKRSTSRPDDQPAKENEHWYFPWFAFCLAIIVFGLCFCIYVCVWLGETEFGIQNNKPIREQVHD